MNPDRNDKIIIILLVVILAAVLYSIILITKSSSNNRVYNDVQPVSVSIGSDYPSGPNQDGGVVGQPNTMGQAAQLLQKIEGDFLQDPHAQSAINQGESVSANFAQHYAFVMIGCGSNCGVPALYDKDSGALYSLPSSVAQYFSVDLSNSDIPTIKSSVSSDILEIIKSDNTSLGKWKLIGNSLVQQ